MPFNGDKQSAGGVFESADVPGPVFEHRLEYDEVVEIRKTDAYKALREEVKRRQDAVAQAGAPTVSR